MWRHLQAATLGILYIFPDLFKTFLLSEDFIFGAMDRTNAIILHIHLDDAQIYFLSCSILQNI